MPHILGHGDAALKNIEKNTTNTGNWPSDKIARRQVADLVPYANNARTHSPAQIDQIAASIREFGFTAPVLLDETDGIIAGHGRVLALKKLGIADVPCMAARGWSVAQKRAYILADNKITLNAGWDDDLLRVELADLQAMDFDLDLTGFSDAEWGALLTDEHGSGRSGAGSLAEKFMIAPFSVLNAREGWWQDRKRAWLSLGIQSELGRGDTAVNSPHEGHGMSDGHEAVRNKQKGRKPDAFPGGGRTKQPHAETQPRDQQTQRQEDR